MLYSERKNNIMKILNMNKKKLIICLSLLILIAGVLLRFAVINNDITGEESDFVLPAKSIAETGHPIFYQSEQVPKETALWHPPMYIFILSSITHFSTNEALIRSLNVAAIFLTSVLIYFFCLNFLKKNGKIIGILSAALFLINYYVLSSSILLDIDALSTLFVFSFVFFILINFKKKTNLSLLLSILSFVFALANRYPIAMLVYAGIFVLIISDKQTRQYYKKYLILGFSSTLIFLLIWTFYSTFIEPDKFFYFIHHNAQLGASQLLSAKVYLLSFALNMSQIIRLFTLPVVLLFLISIYFLYKKKDFEIRAILFYTLSASILFIIVPRPAFGYPRYFLTAMPGLFILISIFFYEVYITKQNMKNNILYASLIGFISLIILMLLNPQLTLYRSEGLIKATNLPDFLFNICGVLPLFLILFAENKNKKTILVLSLFALIISYSLYFDIKFAFNDAHIKDVGDYLRENTNSSDIVIAPKAVAYYTGRKFYINDYYKPALDKLSFDYFLEYFVQSNKNKNMDSSFFWGNDSYGGVFYSNYIKPDQKLYEAKYAVLSYQLNYSLYEKKIGDFYIYRLNDVQVHDI